MKDGKEDNFFFNLLKDPIKTDSSDYILKNLLQFEK